MARESLQRTQDHRALVLAGIFFGSFLTPVYLQPSATETTKVSGRIYPPFCHPMVLQAEILSGEPGVQLPPPGPLVCLEARGLHSGTTLLLLKSSEVNQKALCSSENLGKQQPAEKEGAHTAFPPI